MTTKQPSVPPSLLLSFFESATLKLNQHPVGEAVSGSATCPSSGCDNQHHQQQHLPPPPTRQDVQRELLRIQLECLTEAVARHNQDNGLVGTSDALSVADAQEALKDNDAAIARGMEDAARGAFVRTVLLAEMDWDRRLMEKVHRDGGGSDAGCNQMILEEEKARGLKSGRDNNDVDTAMNRDAIKEFCDLTTAALGMRQIQQYLVEGAEITFHATSSNAEDKDSQVESSAECECECGPNEHNELTPPERMERIHRFLLRAVGYNSEYAKSQMQMLFFPSDDNDGDGKTPLDEPDAELKEAFTKFLTATAAVAANQQSSSSGTSEWNLSDGFTRVVSVQHSEKTIEASSDGGMSSSTKASVPLAQSMEEHDDERQRKQLEMARQAAVLQQGMLRELERMEESERKKVLADARDAHLYFLKQVSELPIGEERIRFLQGIDADTQKKLAIHKLWEARSQ